MNRIEMHQTICSQLHELYAAKNSDYGNSFATVRMEFPNAILIRLSDKLNRLKSLLADENSKEVNFESIEDTLADIANYAMMELVERQVDAENAAALGCTAVTDRE